MRVHPSPSLARTPALLRRRVLAGRPLRRLPHIFSKVLELPFAADADVAIEEDAASLRFVAAGAAGVFPSDVTARAVEIHPGIVKVVVVSDDDGEGEPYAALDLDVWRFRLPESTRPALATAACVGDELVVTVPKAASAEAAFGEGQRLIIVQ